MKPTPILIVFLAGSLVWNFIMMAAFNHDHEALYEAKQDAQLQYPLLKQNISNWIKGDKELNAELETLRAENAKLRSELEPIQWRLHGTNWYAEITNTSPSVIMRFDASKWPTN